MKTKDASFAALENNFKKRMLSAGRIVPFMMVYLQPAHVTDRMLASCGPEGQIRGGGETTNDMRVNCFLKNHQVGSDQANDLRQFPFASSPAKANVVAEQLNNQVAFCASMIVQ